jgi:hypothetical protein
MRAVKIAAAFALALGLGLGLGQAGAFSADPPKADAPEAKAAVTAKAETDELKLPPGWKKKKRGKFMLYCKNEAPMGTRIKAETCYDEDGMRNYMLALQEAKADIDRIRSTCSNICVCGDPSAC